MLDKPDVGSRHLSSQSRPARSPADRNPAIWCKNCKRRDQHYLAVEATWRGNLVWLATFGTIGLFGLYRCVCCGRRRIGRFDIFRGPERPKRNSGKLNGSREATRLSWQAVRRRERFRKLYAGLFSRRKNRSPGFSKRRYW